MARRKPINRFIADGNVVKQPELKKLPARRGGEERDMLEFSIAQSRKAAGEEVTQYIDCVCFDRLATVMQQYLRKGRWILVEGQYVVRKVKTENGERRYHQIVTTNVDFLDAPSR